MSRNLPPQRRLSIWLPRLAIERWIKESGSPDDDVRTALLIEQHGGQRIHALTDAAMESGARVGMRLTDARALDPELQAVDADLDGDAALLARLARWASRWSPGVEVDGADGLMLDVTGVAHLFGGEEALAREVEARFQSLGLTARTAIAPTPLSAWALARYASRRRFPSEAALAAALAPLPVAALRLPPMVVHTLVRLGLKSVGALSGIERRSLARRFREADNPLDALDRALGRKADPMAPAPIVHPPRASLRLAEPVADPAAAPQALDLLVPQLAARLEERKLGARRLVLAAYRVDGEVVSVAAECSLPSREAAHLKRLLKDKAEEIDPGFGVDAFLLEASWCEGQQSAQDGLIAPPPGDRDVAQLIDRLAVKLGAEKIRRPQPRASHLPERASGWRSALAEAAPSQPPPSRAPRPQRLLDRPEAIAVIYATPEGLPRRFQWRRAVHDVARVEGPERIAPEWWRERSTARARDYYRVEDKEGRRYWIYRDGRHGDGRGGDPAWYLHGLFG